MFDRVGDGADRRPRLRSTPRYGSATAAVSRWFHLLWVRRLAIAGDGAPLTPVHLRNMRAATEAGANAFPPVPAFYDRPATVDDIVNHTVGRVLDLFDLDSGLLRRWGELPMRTRPTEAAAV